eukprot:TCALIF_01605-PA protein Name:"Similar to Tmem41a Transmembrane protein 41A (Mus musculus)" AED:0.02 eAED:0.02 QI:0/-1/0/1/-1/1/1/0/240
MIIKHKLGLLLAIFFVSLLWLCALVYFSPLPAETISRFPSTLDEIRATANTLQEFRDDHFGYVILLFASAYLFKQSFAIPGSVLMNVLGGAVLGLSRGFALCSLLTAIGASICYCLARIGGPAVAQEYFPMRFSNFKQRLAQEKHNLAYYLLFLRLFPVSPNWAINMACGALAIPLPIFFVTALVGLMPYNYICVHAGAIITEIESMNDVYKTSTLIQLTAVSVVALLPIMLRRRFMAKR